MWIRQIHLLPHHHSIDRPAQRDDVIAQDDGTKDDSTGGDFQIYNTLGKIVCAMSVEKRGSGWMAVHNAKGKGVAGMEQTSGGTGNVWP